MPKPCTKCDSSGPFYEASLRSRERLCVECVKQRSRDNYHRNAEARRVQKKDYRSANLEKTRSANRQWLAANGADRNARIRERRKGPEGDRVRAKEREQYRLRIVRDPNAIRARDEKRRSAKRAGGAFTGTEWGGLIRSCKGKCLACGRGDLPLTVDHVIPLSKGGLNTIDNIQPLCRSCNSSKGANEVDYRFQRI